MSDEAGPAGSDGDSGLDQDLHDRVADSVDGLLDALDAASASPTADNLDRLRAAADRAMRAIGRVILETERIDKEGG